MSRLILSAQMGLASRLTIRAIKVREFSIPAWNSANVLDFFEWSDCTDAVRLAVAQVREIPRVRMFEVSLLANSGAVGWYGPISETTAAATTALADEIIGQTFDTNLSRFAVLREIASKHPHGNLALGALDCALWDAMARSENVSVGKLLGGNDTCQVACYISLITVNFDGPHTTDLGTAAAKIGFWGQKWRLPEGPEHGAAGLARNIGRIEKLRRAIGPDQRLMIEADRSWDRKYLEEFCRKAYDYSLTWIEEPFERMLSLSEVPEVALAAGESSTSWSDLRKIINSKMCGVVQPDAITCGGLSTMKLARALTAFRQKLFAPHGRALIPAVHVATVVGNAPVVLEYNPLLEPERQAAMGIKLIPSAGFIAYNASKWLGLWPTS